MNAPVFPEATPETAGFWQHLAEGRLVVRVCGKCGAVHPTPRRICPACGATDGVWQDAGKEGRLYSFTAQSFAPPDRPYLPVPLTIGLVDLPVGCRMMALILVGDPGTLTAGQPVMLVPWREGDVVLPAFRPASDEAEALGEGN